MAITSDDRMLFTGSSDKEIKVWWIQNMANLCSIPANDVHELELSPD